MINTNVSKNKEEAKSHIDELVSILNHHSHLYYVDGSPTMMDSEFDKLMSELKQCEESHPDLVREDSPTQRVGGAITGGFDQCGHLMPMLSLEDKHQLKENEAELLRESGVVVNSDAHNLELWYNKLMGEYGTGDVVVEPKIDGVAVSVVYVNGKLDRAVTRGDGMRGDVVTANIKTIRSIPLTLPKGAPKLFEVRGEVFIPLSKFSQLNQERVSSGKEPFANPRNAAAGSLKKLDPNIVASRQLDCIFHSYGECSEEIVESVGDFQNVLQEYGLKQTSLFYRANSWEELKTAIDALSRVSTASDPAHRLDYMIDGAVVKVNDISLHEIIGCTSKHPRWACAYKFLPEQVTTKVLGISIQVGRTGILTPIADLETVHISGTNVSRALLHNQCEIDRKDIRIGDTVVVEKAGEIIPAIVAVDFDSRPSDSAPFSITEHVNHKCPVCGGTIGCEPDEVAIRCYNQGCSAKMEYRLTHLASREALDIDGLGITVAAAIVREGLTKLTDLFVMEQADLAELNIASDGEPERRLGNSNAAKIIASLDHAKEHKPLHCWIYALGIPLVGRSVSKEISRVHSRLSDLAHSPIIRWLAQEDSEQRTEELKDFGLKSNFGRAAAKSLLQFDWKTLLTDLKELEISPKSINWNPFNQKPKSSSSVSGKKFVITGTLSQPRNHFKELIESLGGSVASSVSKSTDYLLCGKNVGASKTEKASKTGTAILTEDEFNSLTK